ncbi:D-amino-acid transaminase [Halalkalibacillus sediminis]|uniref:D-alanine aminotransferase n=1 Tax=Halalkalibacillus sediminis TaxID=2018042 RepID=A0A2I0QVG6_9BACI|nr:D-amino-acid transaminase [Halalkalibacillus sediminis]PKR78326.1 D-amino-acid transaminase [Halalkalibacillus sediminis]
MIILKNNQLVQREEAIIDMEDRGFQFGDGVYEVIRIYEGKFFLMNEHLERLQYSLTETGIEFDIKKGKLAEQLEDLAEKNQIDDGAIYIQITRGIAPRSHPYPTEAIPTLMAYPIPISRPIKLQESGAKVILEEDVRWLRCDIKSLNLLGNVMAKQTAKEAEAFEAILYRNPEHVTEGSSTNVFIVKDGKVITHPANNFILNGITRRYIHHLSNQLGITFEEDVFSVDELLNADEVFLASTTSEVMPVTQIDDYTIGNGEPGSISRKLLDEFFKHVDTDQIRV